jgi:hypothetical protein
VGGEAGAQRLKEAAARQVEVEKQRRAEADRAAAEAKAAEAAAASVARGNHGNGGTVDGGGSEEETR